MPPRKNSSGKSDDEKLLIAILSLWDPLPPVDYHKLGALLGIKPGTARVRWHRFKAKLFKDSRNKTAEDDVKVEQTTAALDNPAREKEASEDAGIEQVAEEIDVKRRGRTGVRKRAATVGNQMCHLPGAEESIGRLACLRTQLLQNRDRAKKGRQTNTTDSWKCLAELSKKMVNLRITFSAVPCPNKNRVLFTMTTESVKDQRLIAAVHKRINLSEISSDYEQLAEDLGIKAMHPAKAASKRWIRYKQKNGLVPGISAKK
ncbi:hypothetical protein H4I95_11290 [Botrytis cinerea]